MASPLENEEFEPRAPRPESSEGKESESDEADEADSESSIFWSNASECYPNGKYPSVSINNRKMVVVVFNRGKHNDLLFQVGKLRGDMHGNIAWGDSYRYDKGFNPTVAINDEGNVVEVHQSHWRRALFYRVGTINKENKTIVWVEEKSTYFSSGEKPAVALDNNGRIVEVHVTRGNDTFCRVGALEKDSGITWCDLHRYGVGKSPRVTINDEGTVVEVHELVQPRRTNASITGQLPSESDASRVKWGPIVILGNGLRPQVSLNNDNRVVEVHERGFRNIFYNKGLAHTDARSLTGLGEGEVYEKHRLCAGTCPAISINDKGNIVFVCETSNQLKHTLLCHTGIWKKEEKKED